MKVTSNNLHPASRSIGTPQKPFLREIVNDLTVTLSNGDTHEIKAGFQTDLGSVPRIFWSWVSPFGRDELAFIVHDYLIDFYSNKYSREFIDGEMRNFQRIVEVDPRRTEIMYKAVRLYDYFKKLKKLLYTS